jgi:hypothetical protein
MVSIALERLLAVARSGRGYRGKGRSESAADCRCSNQTVNN